MQKEAYTVADAARRALKAAMFTAWDIVDGTCLKLTSQSDVPPFSLRKHVAPLDRFVPTIEEYIAYFKLLGGLTMSDAVLDIGCGTGRFAHRLLSKPHYFHGTYYGFDPERRCIAWANQNIARTHPNAHFTTVDLKNLYYNPKGSIDPTTFTFPFSNAQFDFVFAWSIFTHLMPDVTSRYLKEIYRVLKPGKRAVVTCLMLDGYPETLREDIIKTRTLEVEASKWHHHGSYSVLHPDEPEKVLAYQRSFFTDEVRQAGLTLERTCNGCWNHLENYLSEQDVLVLSKPAD